MTVLDQERPRLRNIRIVLETAVVVVFVLLVWSNFALRRQRFTAAAGAPAAHRGFAPRDYLTQIPIVDSHGVAGTLDLQKGRTTIAVVDPRCDSCRDLLSTLNGAPVQVISLAPPEITRTIQYPHTSMIAGRLPEAADKQLHSYPQLFVVDHGSVVRTCIDLSECR